MKIRSAKSSPLARSCFIKYVNKIAAPSPRQKREKLPEIRESARSYFSAVASSGEKSWWIDLKIKVLPQPMNFIPSLKCVNF
jgi:hypothetical protein